MHNLLKRFYRIKGKNLAEWKIILEEVIDLCLKVSEIVSPIVSSNSPEGIFPMELFSGKKNKLNKLIENFNSISILLF